MLYLVPESCIIIRKKNNSFPLACKLEGSKKKSGSILKNSKNAVIFVPWNCFTRTKILNMLILETNHSKIFRSPYHTVWGSFFPSVEIDEW